ncbi:MAG: PQQ-binding-like beta-propeller repeat protein [Vampirovibrionales bacterium]|nr:PQQ-binding-like beta-propeller repeat protein [Vampirovibrionales bacterium]
MTSALIPTAHARVKPISLLAIGGPSVVASGRYAVQAPPQSQWQINLPSERIAPVVSVGPYWVTALKEDATHKAPRIVAYRWTTGEEVWAMPLPEGTETVGLIPSSIYGKPSNPVELTSAPLIATLPMGIVFKVNCETGRPEWVKALPVGAHELHLTPVLDLSGLTVVSTASTLFHLNPTTGELLWQTPIKPPPSEGASQQVSEATPEPAELTPRDLKPLALSPLATNGQRQLLLGTEDGFLTSVDALTGKILWHSQTAGSVRSLQWIVDRWVVTSNTGLLTAVNPDSGSSQWALVSLDGKPLVSSTNPTAEAQWVTASLKGNVLMANAKTGIRSGSDTLPNGLTGGWTALSDGSLLGTLTDGKLIAYDPPKPQNISGYRAVKRNKHTQTKTPSASNIRWELPLNHRVIEPPVMQPLSENLWLLTASTDGTVLGFNWAATAP